MLQVTLAGVSSGSTSIMGLLTNAEASTYFQRVWVSGVSARYATPEEGAAAAEASVYMRLGHSMLCQCDNFPLNTFMEISAKVCKN